MVGAHMIAESYVCGLICVRARNDWKQARKGASERGMTGSRPGRERACERGMTGSRRGGERACERGMTGSRPGSERASVRASVRARECKAIFSYLLMYCVPQFTEATDIITLESVKNA